MKTWMLTLGVAVVLAGCVTPPKNEPQLQPVADATVGLGTERAPAV